jgi:hypothetical protein
LFYFQSQEPELCGTTPGVGATPGKGGYQGGTMINTPGRLDTSYGSGGGGGGGGNALGLSGIQLQVIILKGNQW